MQHEPTFTRISTELPDQAFLSLTEAFTWILFGERLDDEAVTLRRHEQIEDDRADWGSSDGPIGLFGALELIASENPPRDQSEDCQRITERAIKLARDWLAKRQVSVADGLELVRQELTRREALDEKVNRLQALCFDRCARGHMTLHARELSSDGKDAHREHLPIPAAFFMKEVRLTMGNGYSRQGELKPVMPRDKLFEHVYGDYDPRSSYFDVMIASEEAELLMRWFSQREDIHTRDTIINNVRRGQMCSAEAEEKLRKLGQGPLFQQPDPELCDPLRMNSWTFAMAVAWISTRQIDFVREYTVEHLRNRWFWQEVNAQAVQPDGSMRLQKEFCENRVPFKGPFDELPSESIEGQPAVMTVSVAKRLLWSALQQSQLTASAVDPDKNKPALIPSHEFHHLEMVSKHEEDRLCVTTNSDWYNPAYLRPVLERVEVMSIWGTHNLETDDFSPNSAARAKNSLGLEQTAAINQLIPSGPVQKALHEAWPKIFEDGVTPLDTSRRDTMIYEYFKKHNPHRQEICRKTIRVYVKWRKKQGLP